MKMLGNLAILSATKNLPMCIENGIVTVFINDGFGETDDYWADVNNDDEIMDIINLINGNEVKK